MLVIHGAKDFRVPISEGLRLWTDLTRHGVEAKFLYFPDENHWILKPQNASLWYETVLAFLDQYVLGQLGAGPTSSSGGSDRHPLLGQRRFHGGQQLCCRRVTDKRGDPMWAIGLNPLKPLID